VADRSTPSQRDALARVTQEFADIRRRFDEDDRRGDAEWAETHTGPLVAVADWEHLLNAVKSKVRQVVDSLTAAGSASGRNGHTEGVSDLLESVTALDRVHVMLAHEFARRSCLSALDERLAQAPAAVVTTAPRPALALLYVDLDDFRSIDGSRGRAAGDQVLAMIAVRLGSVMRVRDSVRHLGRDALVCLLGDGSDREQVLRLVSKLADAVSVPVTVGAVKLTVRPTIGIATNPAQGASAEILLRRADAAMTRAKRQQTTYAFFDERIDG
jgi:diguanylate cyclase (GGDEF)-like protein